jgi:hypothetical protein
VKLIDSNQLADDIRAKPDLKYFNPDLTTLVYSALLHPQK